ncbi:MAG: DUF5716 family protein [Eubacteriales bacterium]|nr:DUF5716 family protein [Eubacteriales bacterium]
MEKTIIGLDLDRENAQISFYNTRSMELETVSTGQNCYLIPTPEDLFPLIEESVELGLMALANFLKSCISLIKPAVRMDMACMMVTMKEMRLPWPDAIRDACEMLGMCREDVFLQTHAESFCSYTLNQKKDIWMRRVALFEYEGTKIYPSVLSVDYGTKPALVTVEQKKEVQMGTKGIGTEQEWNEKRDRLFLQAIEDTFGAENFSAAYLIGDSFDKSWAVESLQFLCRRRHVFQGRNLYTKGACYAAMQRMGVGKNLDAYLYYSEDMVETNLSMRMEIRGKASSYLLVNAGVNWFEAGHICEFIPDGTNEIVIYGRSMRGGDAESYSIVLKGLPQRPGRTTRLWLQASFLSAKRCKITIRDLGFGEFYPPSGMVWESILEV